MARVLLTGSLGFIGSLLHQELQQRGHNVFGFDSRPPSGIDLTNYELTKEVVGKLFRNPEVIVHLAANTNSKLAQENPRADFMGNSVGTLHALELAREFGAKLIYPSTVKVIPNGLGQRSPYGMSKYVGELLCNEWRNTFGVQSIVNRFGHLYGIGKGGTGDHFWVNALVKKAMAEEEIEVWGEGTHEMPVLWITDLITLLADQVENFDKYEAVMRGLPEPVLYATGGEANKLSVVGLLKKLNYTNYTHKPALLGDVSYVPQGKEEAARLVGKWKPTVGVDEGVERLKNHYGDN